MNNEWQQFLEANGAVFGEGEVKHYGEPDAELQLALEADTLCDLSHDGLIRVRGEDSINFLQGQFTNDVRTLSETRHQLSSYCSPKGRMLVLFRLFRRDTATYLQLPSVLLEATLKRLKMFVLMAKVELEDVSDELVRFALAGPSADKLLATRLGKLPAEIDESLTLEGITVLRIAGKQPRFILHGSREAMSALWRKLTEAGARPVGAEAWRLQEIHAAIPSVLPETVDAFVPQMLNLQQLNGVSFKKGCYTGQEVVARMQYLGKLKRRMYLAHLDSTTRPAVGAQLSAPDSGSGQGAGKVVNVASTPQGGYDILAVMEIASADAGQVYLDEQPLTLMPLPYSMESSGQAPQAAG